MSATTTTRRPATYADLEAGTLVYRGKGKKPFVLKRYFVTDERGVPVFYLKAEDVPAADQSAIKVILRAPGAPFEREGTVGYRLDTLTAE